MGNVKLHAHFEGKGTHNGEEGGGARQGNVRRSILVLPIPKGKWGSTNNGGPRSCLERQ
jgi:hypothetical protein